MTKADGVDRDEGIAFSAVSGNWHCAHRLIMSIDISVQSHIMKTIRPQLYKSGASQVLYATPFMQFSSNQSPYPK